MANETSGVRRLTVPSGQTVTLYCPKTSFENYQGLWERHFHLRTSNLEPMFSYQIFHGGVYNLAKKHKSNIAGRGPDFQDQPKLAVECVNQYL